ncbi:MAG: HAD-IIIA family hydrolase, partial [Desulfobacula sp.]|nr:HAD-IIIA family hydrolase [Desulfobacula sp.]
MDYIVFLDRDGVINVDSPEYIKNESEFEFIPKSPEAIALLTQNGFNVIVITNQSLIGRKMVT